MALITSTVGSDVGELSRVSYAVFEYNQPLRRANLVSYPQRNGNSTVSENGQWQWFAAGTITNRRSGIQPAVFAVLTSVRDRETGRQTDRPLHSVCNNRPYV